MTTVADYPYKTVPWKHQREEFERTRDLPFCGLAWEMGVAKTKPIIDTMSWLWLTGKIDGVLVVAPEGVNVQWIKDEIPDHMPMLVQDSLDTFIWLTSKAEQIGFNKQWKAFLGRPKSAGLSVLTMTYDALMTDAGAKAAKAFLIGRRCLINLDESTKIKTPGTQVTKRVMAMAKYAPYRRITNGTPIADSPFHLYTQLKFLNPDCWKHLDIGDAAGFRTYFGEFEKRVNRATKQSYDALLSYKNLDDMAAVFASLCTRYTKAQVFPNLPPKVFSKHYFTLSPKQRKAYDDLANNMMTWLANGEMVTAELAIVRQTRLQQICSGYIPADDDDKLTPLVAPKDNPRLKLLLDVLEDLQGKVIIWGKYDIDVDLIGSVLREKRGWELVTWDGRTSEADRATAKERFVKDPNTRAFIGKASSSAARGLNLQVANTVVFYNNSFVADDRLQAEDRAHRPGIHSPVKYIDLVAEGTIDEHIVKSLRAKRDVAAIVTGDELSPWI